MNVVRATLWLLICGCAWSGQLAVAHTVPARQGAAVFSGKGYVRLGDWARANGFDLRWDKAGDDLRLSNNHWQIILPKDSREAELGGVHVCLSYPVLVQNGVAFISQVDLDTAIKPLLFPIRNKARRIRNIVIDPGHGGKDPGNVVGSQQEKKYTLLLAQELGEQLRRAGFNVSLTRTTDVFVELPSRPEIARHRGADLFISVHWNELPGNHDMKGAQTFCLTPAGATSSNSGNRGFGPGPSPGNRYNERNMLLAYQVQKSLLNLPGLDDRGVRRARYWVLRDASMPAILIEGGFMSNSAEARRIYDAGYRRQMAHAIVEGVLAYQRLIQ